MTHDKIIIRGAREHNLKNIDVELPRGKLIVLTGLSGSGKSSLAFDTLYAEGQRRYVESLSTYARQFLGQMEKPDVDQIEGLSPAISIDQRGVSHNPRSTVGTVTEIYDHLRLLYARIGVPHCPACGQIVQRQTPDQIADSILALPDGTRILILAPLVRGRKGSHEQILEDIRRAGFVRVRIDGQLVDTSEPVELDRYRSHTIEAVVDRLIVRSGPEGLDRTRLIDSLETALKLGRGIVIVGRPGPDPEPDLLYSEHFACPDCGISLPQIEPRSFSFNSPHGACPSCQGLGIQQQVDPELVIANPNLTLRQGAIAPWSKSRFAEGYFSQLIASAAHALGIDLDTPWRDLPEAAQKALLYGTGEQEIEVRYATRHGERQRYNVRFEGVIPNLERRYESTDSDYVRSEIERYMSVRPCPACQGGRLRPEMAAVTVAGRSIIEVSRMPIRELLDWVRGLRADRPSQATEQGLTARELMIAGEILKEIEQRLSFLVDVGLDYLALDRRAATLAGGEAQRIRLATQIGSRLVGVLYILDEPSIGLHPRDNGRLIRTLASLRDLGNTVVVVEHDEAMIRAADWVVDLGPGAGEHGGWVVAEGPVSAIERHPTSVTGQFLSRRRTIPVPPRRRRGTGKWVTIKGASANNLKSIDVSIPLGTFTVVTGVSGSGKSTLILEILYRRLQQLLGGSREPAGAHRSIEGYEHIDKVVHIDQSPIGRTPRSNPATYTNVFTPIRELFAALPEARLRGYRAGRFSFNVRGGRCEACQGDGILKIEMQFLPDVYVPCEVCHGSRYNRETLQIKYHDLSIADVLNLTVSEATQLFSALPAIRRKLETLEAVGLGYIRLGQPAPTLSGGEAQRVKLSRELSRVATGDTLYILDEPTTGLHFADVERLLQVLHALVDAGNTVVVIEHNLDVIKTADWVIDLGPEGGDRGGEVVVVGTPEQVAVHPVSHTGAFLRPLLEERQAPRMVESVGAPEALRAE